MDSIVVTNARTSMAIRPWWPVFVGLLFLYIPTYFDLATGVWQEEEYAHGSIAFFVVVWLFWKKSALLENNANIPNPLFGGIFLTIGLMSYVVGRSQDITFIEVASQIPVFIGVVLLFLGKSALKKLWFPLFFLVFLIPLPSFFTDLLTGPLKHYVSLIVEEVLYFAGYPIARSGVVLNIGVYQLLIADACSGLNSMYALSALGALYLYLRGQMSAAHRAILIICILPIAFVTNVIRVLALVLITHHFGDDAGQGFLHDFAAVIEFAIALLLLFSIDNTTQLIRFRKRSLS